VIHAVTLSVFFCLLTGLQTMDSKRTGILLISRKNLKDLEYAGDLPFLSHSVNRMHDKTRQLQYQCDYELTNATKIMKMKTYSIPLTKSKSSHTWEVW